MGPNSKVASVDLEVDIYEYISGADRWCWLIQQDYGLLISCSSLSYQAYVVDDHPKAGGNAILPVFENQDVTDSTPLVQKRL